MKKICKKFKSYAARFTELKSNKSGSPDSGSLNEYNFDLVPEVSGEHFPQKERASFWTTFKWLLWRCMKQQYLDPAFLAAKVLQIFGTSITIGEPRTYIPKIILKNSPLTRLFQGILFLRVPWDEIYTGKDIFTLTSALFVMVTCYSTCFLFTIVVEFPMQMPVLQREIYSQHYSVTGLFLMKIFNLCQPW